MEEHLELQHRRANLERPFDLEHVGLDLARSLQICRRDEQRIRQIDPRVPHAALDAIATIPEPARSSFNVATVEAAALGVLGRHEPEIVLYERLLAANPKHAGLWTTYGNALKYAGRGDDASRALRRAVQIRPGYGEGWWAIANLKSERLTDRDIKVMRQALARDPALDDAMQLRFASGRAYEERRMYADSFEHYDAGNRLRAGSLTPQAKSVAATVDEMVATFDPGLLPG